VPTLAPFADVATDVTGLDSGVLHGCNVAC
jgi:hypothetical protein